MSSNWTDLVAETRKSFREEIDAARPSESSIDRYIYETADGAVPIYNVSLLELAIDNIHLALTEPDIPASNAIEMIQHNAYDELVSELWEEWEEAKTEWKEWEEAISDAEYALEEYLDEHPDLSGEEVVKHMTALYEGLDIDPEQTEVYDDAWERLEAVYNDWKEEHDAEAVHGD